MNTNYVLNETEKAERYRKNLYRQMNNVEQLKKELNHIKKPYSLHQIIDQYCKGDYNSELLLQHCLIILTNNNFKFDSSDDCEYIK